MSRPVGSNKYTATQFIEAISKSGGIVSTIAQRVGCSWRTARKYIDEYPTVKAAFEDEKNGMLDMARSVVYQNIQNAYKTGLKGTMADSTDAKWVLARLDPEFRDKQEIEHTGSIENRMLIVPPKKDE